MCDQVLLYQQMVRPHPTDHLDDGGICFADLLFPLADDWLPVERLPIERLLPLEW